MQCAAPLNKKRPLESEEPWRPKRVCLEAGLQAVECPMETMDSFTPSNQQQEQQVRLTCLRCLGGEPGHINHIMGV